MLPTPDATAEMRALEREIEAGLGEHVADCRCSRCVFTRVAVEAAIIAGKIDFALEVLFSIEYDACDDNLTEVFFATLAKLIRKQARDAQAAVGGMS